VLDVPFPGLFIVRLPCLRHAQSVERQLLPAARLRVDHQPTALAVQAHRAIPDLPEEEDRTTRRLRER
jgi:hypothetical protein